MKQLLISIILLFLFILSCSKAENSSDSQTRAEKEINKTIEQQSINKEQKGKKSEPSIQTDTKEENTVKLSKQVKKKEDTQAEIKSEVEKRLAKKPEGQKQIKVERKILDSQLYDFTLTSLSGEGFTLSEIPGMIIMDFWATWCPPCRVEIPYLQSFYEEYKDKGLMVIGISGDAPEKLIEFKQKMKENGTDITYALLLDKGNEVARQYGIRAIPTTYFISKEGKVLSKHTGFRPDFAEEFEETIKKELGLD